MKIKSAYLRQQTQIHSIHAYLSIIPIHLDTIYSLCMQFFSKHYRLYINT